MAVQGLLLSFLSCKTAVRTVTHWFPDLCRSFATFLADGYTKGQLLKHYSSLRIVWFLWSFQWLASFWSKLLFSQLIQDPISSLISNRWFLSGKIGQTTLFSSNRRWFPGSQNNAWKCPLWIQVVWSRIIVMPKPFVWVCSWGKVHLDCLILR